MEEQRTITEETLDATIVYLEGLPTTVSPESAVSSISDWEHRVRSAGKPELTAVADELANLGKLLASGDLDGHAIGTSMTKLGEYTTLAAHQGGSGPLSARLIKLGDWLSKVGKTMVRE